MKSNYIILNTYTIVFKYTNTLTTQRKKAEYIESLCCPFVCPSVKTIFTQYRLDIKLELI